jgi:peptide/nickel transport system substrate-binding protein
MRRRSNFVLEALAGGITAPGNPTAGTGAFVASPPRPDGAIAMTANAAYREGPPHLSAIEFRPYTSVRSAWADLLRGEVDMLYEVGTDALDSLETSSRVRVFTFPRNYAYLLILNVRRPSLRAPEVRRLLNAAVDREALVAQALGGHGRPADTPIRPEHWAHDPHAPRFTYAPAPLGSPLRLHCLFGDPSLERLAVALQRQLQAIGVELVLERIPVDQIYERTTRGDFDVLLADVVAGPTLVRPLWFWYSNAQFNWGGYSNPAVDRALDAVREAPDDAAYRAGVSAFERAIADDPPAVFIAWSERARAVSAAFDVPAEPGRDILGSLRLWRPAAGAVVRH